MSATFNPMSLTFTEVRRQIIANAVAVFPSTSIHHGRSRFEVIISLVNSSNGDGTNDRYRALLVYRRSDQCCTIAESSPQPTIQPAAENLLSVLADVIAINGRIARPGERAERASLRIGGILWKEPVSPPRPSNPVAAELEAGSLDDEAVASGLSSTFLNPRAAPPVPGRSLKSSFGSNSLVSPEEWLLALSSAPSTAVTHPLMRSPSRRERATSGLSKVARRVSRALKGFRGAFWGSKRSLNE